MKHAASSSLSKRAGMLVLLLMPLVATGCGTLEVGIEMPVTPERTAMAPAVVRTAAATAAHPTSPPPTPSATLAARAATPSPLPSATEMTPPVTPSATATACPTIPSPTSSATKPVPSATPTATATARPETPPATATRTPTSAPQTPAPTLAVEHWQGEYYDNMVLSGSPALVRDDEEITFHWGTESPIPGTIGVDEFSVRWSRQLDLPPGTYRFTMTVDDGGRLYVRDHLLIDVWKDQRVSVYTDDIFLPGGPVAVQMEYYENREAAVAELMWERVQPTPADTDWRIYSNPYFGIALRHPPGWEPVPGYGEPGAGEKLAGEDGFFLINAMGDSEIGIDDATAAEAYHILQPYGTQPIVESLQVEGQEARLILPSADASIPDQATLLVRYPQPVTIDGHTYQFFVLYADQDHIRLIADTLHFGVEPDVG